MTAWDEENPWTDERVQQLDTDAMSAFGIRIASRHANAQEMIELLEFARACCASGVNIFVIEAFYDSKQSCCNLMTSPALNAAGPAARQAVFDAARETLSQFLWEGGIHHGRDGPDREGPP